jgi:hypothetical protein
LLVAALAGFAVVLLQLGLAQSGGVANAAKASTDPTGTVTWNGVNGLDKIQTCAPGQTITYHWILTPGGSTTFQSGTLVVTYQNGAPSTTTQGSVQGNVHGALQFFVTPSQFDIPATAVATVTFTGSLDNAVLTISSTECVPTSTTTPPTTPTTPTTTPPTTPTTTPPTTPTTTPPTPATTTAAAATSTSPFVPGAGQTGDTPPGGGFPLRQILIGLAIAMLGVAGARAFQLLRRSGSHT